MNQNNTGSNGVANNKELESPSNFTPEWFLSINKIILPKKIPSLLDLWDHMFEKKSEYWRYLNSKPKDLYKTFNTLVELAEEAKKNDEKKAELTRLINSIDNVTLLGIVRNIHLRTHLRNLDDAATYVELPAQNKETGLLGSKLIVHSYIEYLKKHGTESFEKFINEACIRLVSTAHPNETERNTNLMHLTSLLDKYITWKKDLESVTHLPTFSPEYRIRRENLNQLRRAIKSEIEGFWQNNYRRKGPIPVESEARRLLERYKTIFKALPPFMKMIKHLAIEAFWLYQASIYVNDEKWLKTFESIYNESNDSRDDKLEAIKATFATLGINLKPPRINAPIISFSSWKGGDRDGNPFVIASFSNQIFVEQKLFVLTQYIEIVRNLVDKLTVSTEFNPVSERLKASLIMDRKNFPYLNNIKPWEPYRAKLKYILEKLKNTYKLVKVVKESSGSTTKPLLGRTLPGPAGYNDADSLLEDIDAIYSSLLENGSKAQARSYVQDLKILVTTFGMHLTSIDFRQHSKHNFNAVYEYLKQFGYPLADQLKTSDELEKRKILIDIIGGTNTHPVEFDPWIIPSLSKLSKDTFETFLIFADAAVADKRCVGKFIISMCSNVSDMLIILTLMKFVGMLQSSNGTITQCSYDVTGLFETIEDLKSAHTIIKEYIEIPMIKNYICEHRNGQVTAMMGYSDSVRDGSSLASDAQITRTGILIRRLEEQLNENQPKEKQIKIVFYRGRGDTIPRGYGGSISKAINSQLITSTVEDHTEQNRFLRHYSSVSSTMDHLHSTYAAHLSKQVDTVDLCAAERYQKYFDFYGRISNLKWNHLVQSSGVGDQYFALLNKYSILPHLPKAHFASRPVARDGVIYNIDTIRAIPFTMFLAQMREFTNAYYGTGTAIHKGNSYLDNEGWSTYKKIIKILSEQDDDIENVLSELNDDNLNYLTSLYMKESKFNDVSEVAKSVEREELDGLLLKVLHLYPTLYEGIKELTSLLVDLKKENRKAIEILQEMYQNYAPFQYSIQNKESSLIIRDKEVVDMYTSDANKEEKSILNMTHEEAELTKACILEIMQQKELESKTLKQDFRSAELEILHRVQCKFLKEYNELESKCLGKSGTESIESQVDVYVQMTILAISEALGFAFILIELTFF